jgi:coenzyme F420-reducing hydrogenase beta subunit
VLARGSGSLAAGDWSNPRVFAAWSLDDRSRVESSSGGVFSELARAVIEAGGLVAGCCWAEGWVPEHRLARTKQDVEDMRGSKYAPSRVRGVYEGVLAHLRSADTPVVFSGTPCQVAAMSLCLSQEQRSRVLLVDLVCHGVPSLRVFHAYLHNIFHGATVEEFRFRHKTVDCATVRARATNHDEYRVPSGQDPFFAGYAVHHCYLQPACHACAFARLPRTGDVSLGDFWGCPAAWDDKRGVSLALANTPAGLQAVESLRAAGRIALESSDLPTATRLNRRIVSGHHDVVPRRRRMFLDGLASGQGFAALAAKHFPSRWEIMRRRFWRADSRWAFLRDLVREQVGKRLFRRKADSRIGRKEA